MLTISVSAFKATIAERLRMVQAGERIVITDHNRPIALVSPTQDHIVEREALHPFVAEMPVLTRPFTGSVAALLDAERGDR
ncbi:MAG: type II toxin-antitoxin system prevent-host-death family antitoxin [Spirochaetota bacterium]